MYLTFFSYSHFVDFRFIKFGEKKTKGTALDFIQKML